MTTRTFNTGDLRTDSGLIALVPAKLANNPLVVDAYYHSVATDDLYVNATVTPGLALAVLLPEPAAFVTEVTMDGSRVASLVLRRADAPPTESALVIGQMTLPAGVYYVCDPTFAVTDDNHHLPLVNAIKLVHTMPDVPAAVTNDSAVSKAGNGVGAYRSQVTMRSARLVQQIVVTFDEPATWEEWAARWATESFTTEHNP